MNHVIALCGGVGGAKLAAGLTRALTPGDLTVIVNTGDDFVHLGLNVSPDLDTVTYTLSGLADRERGWGVAGETWHFMDALTKLDGETWFMLGDRDLATHVERTRRLRAGETLSQVTAALNAALGIRHTVVPATDDRLATFVMTDEGELEFQRYFVERRCAPRASAIRFAWDTAPHVSPGAAKALDRKDVAMVLICPSNPYLSVDPILAVPTFRKRLAQIAAPIVAVSPIINGQALKGPAAKLMLELGKQPGVLAVAEHYHRLIDGLVIDRSDADQADLIRATGVEPLVTDAIMRDDADRERLANETLSFAHTLSAKRA